MKYNNNVFEIVPLSFIIQILINYYVVNVNKIVKYVTMVQSAKFVKMIFSFLRVSVSFNVLLECGAIIIKHLPY